MELSRISYHLGQHGDAPGHLGHVLHLDEVVQVEEILFRNAKFSQILQQDLDPLLGVGSLQVLELLSVDFAVAVADAATAVVVVVVAAVVMWPVDDAQLRLQLG